MSHGYHSLCTLHVARRYLRTRPEIDAPRMYSFGYILFLLHDLFLRNILIRSVLNEPAHDKRGLM